MKATSAPATDRLARLRRPWREPLAWILLAAALLRLAFFIQVRNEPTFTVPHWDSAIFDDMARSIARGHGSGLDKAYFFGPLYAYALGLVYAVTGSDRFHMIILQHLLGLGLGALTYRLARRWFGRAESLTAAALLLFTGLEVFFEGKLLMEVLVSALLAGALLLLSDPGPCRARRLAAAGLLLGLAAAGRPSLLLLAPLAVIPLRKPAAAAGRLRLAAAFAAGVLLAPTATLVRNLAVEGVPVLISASGGYNFYAGNAHGARERSRLDADSSFNAENTAEAELGRDLDSAEVSRYWSERALTEIARDPARWLARFAGRCALYVGGQDVPQIEWYDYERRRWPVLGRATLGTPTLMTAALAGIVVLLPRRRELALLYGALLLITIGVALIFVTTRFRVVALPYACVFAGAFLVAAARAVRARAWRVVGLLAGAALLGAVATAPAWRPADERWLLYVQNLHEGLQYTRADSDSAAVRSYRTAIELAPEDYEGHLGLGVAQRELGDPISSLAAIEAAARCPHTDADVPYQWAVTLHALGRYVEAEQSLVESLQLDPRRGTTVAYLGLVRAAQGRFAEATADIERGLELDPAQPHAWNNLGALRGRHGDLAGAREAFERALREDPGFTPARVNLAKWLLDTGDRTAAARALQRVLADDPQHPEATALMRELR